MNDSQSAQPQTRLVSIARLVRVALFSAAITSIFMLLSLPQQGNLPLIASPTSEVENKSAQIPPSWTRIENSEAGFSIECPDFAPLVTTGAMSITCAKSDQFWQASVSVRATNAKSATEWIETENKTRDSKLPIIILSETQVDGRAGIITYVADGYEIPAGVAGINANGSMTNAYGTAAINQVEKSVFVVHDGRLYQLNYRMTDPENRRFIESFRFIAPQPAH